MALKNPYVGPRAFRIGESLYNRGQEAAELTNLILAERIVLLHAPSGAGKTSLIQTSVRKNLLSAHFQPTETLRVRCVRPSGSPGPNRYVEALAADLTENHDLAGMELADVFSVELGGSVAGQERRVIVIDQLEEVLADRKSDVDEKIEFFCELGKAIDANGLWALLAIRDDFVGALEPYLCYLPQPPVNYRLGFLSEQDAMDAIQLPAAEQDVTFTDAAARKLVRRLSRTARAEPFQLQVACRQLWKDWRRVRGDDFPVIDEADVAEVDIGRALGRYYSHSMEELVRDHPDVSERGVRDWFEEHLITEGRRRTQTTHGPVDSPDCDKVLARLEDMYLIRSDTRAGTRWYELAHDQLVSAVLEENRAWQLRNLDSWQVAAYEWRRRDRQQAFLLPRSKIPYAPSATMKELLPHESAFLAESFEAASKVWRARLAANSLKIVTAIALLELVLLIALVVWGWSS